MPTAARTSAASGRAALRRRRAGVGPALAGALALGLALGGCSQIAALAPVGGDAIAEVRYGAIDVLLANDIDVLEAPTCTTQGASTGTATPAQASDAGSPTPDAPTTPSVAGAVGTGETGETVVCTGSTISGETITVTSSTAADAQLEVSVGARSLYDGPLQTVIDQAVRP